MTEWVAMLPDEPDANRRQRFQGQVTTGHARAFGMLEGSSVDEIGDPGLRAGA